MINNRRVIQAYVAASTMAAGAFSFQPVSRSSSRSDSSLKVSVDPNVVTKKEYQDICGTGFDDRALEERLQYTNFLYPKHVEVINDIAPIAGKMVDDVVRMSRGNFGDQTNALPRPWPINSPPSDICEFFANIFYSK
jgi:hypothetical protein